MKYFISNRYDGCWYYRCYLPMYYNGFSGDKESWGADKDRAKDSALVLKADTVIFQRPDEESKLHAAVLLQRAGKKIVFENDDTYKDDNPMKLKGVENRSDILDAFVRMADMVTTTTEFLADEYRKLNKNVVVLKNCIDPRDWPHKVVNDTDKVRIGIFGSATLNGDCEPILRLLESFKNRDDIQLVIFGLPDKTASKEIKELYKDDIKFWDNLDVEWHPFSSMKDYFKTLASLKLDIALVPRKDNYFNRCKSNLKFLEASMLEIPVVAQGFNDGLSPYQGADDKDFMFIAKTDEDWSVMTERLIQDKDFRVILGQEAKKYVLKNYNIKDNFKNWAEAYKKI